MLGRRQQLSVGGGAIPLALLFLLAVFTPLLAVPVQSASAYLMIELALPAKLIFNVGIDQQPIVCATLLCVGGLYLVWIRHDRRRICIFNLLILATLFIGTSLLLMTLVSPFVKTSDHIRNK